jgi:hypothetical protein
MEAFAPLGRHSAHSHSQGVPWVFRQRVYTPWKGKSTNRNKLGGFSFNRSILFIYMWIERLNKKTFRGRLSDWC